MGRWRSITKNFSSRPSLVMPSWWSFASKWDNKIILVEYTVLFLESVTKRVTTSGNKSSTMKRIASSSSWNKISLFSSPTKDQTICLEISMEEMKNNKTQQCFMTTELTFSNSLSVLVNQLFQKSTSQNTRNNYLLSSLVIILTAILLLLLVLNFGILKWATLWPLVTQNYPIFSVNLTKLDLHSVIAEILLFIFSLLTLLLKNSWAFSELRESVSLTQLRSSLLQLFLNYRKSQLISLLTLKFRVNNKMKSNRQADRSDTSQLWTSSTIFQI